jgi:hypothetical protein
VVTAIKGNQGDVAAQFNSDITGSGGFFVWIGVLLLIAVGGRVLGLPKGGKMLIVLIIAVYVISQNGVFTQLSKGLSNASAPAPATVTSAGAEAAIPGTTPSSPTPVAKPDTGTPPPADTKTPFSSLLGGAGGLAGLRNLLAPSPPAN